MADLYATQLDRVQAAIAAIETLSYATDALREWLKHRPSEMVADTNP